MNTNFIIAPRRAVHSLHRSVWSNKSKLNGLPFCIISRLDFYVRIVRGNHLPRAGGNILTGIYDQIIKATPTHPVPPNTFSVCYNIFNEFFKHIRHIINLVFICCCRAIRMAWMYDPGIYSGFARNSFSK